MQLEQTVQRGIDARQILSSDIFKDMVTSLNAKYTEALIKSQESDSAEREKLYLKIRVLDDLVTEMTITEHNGVKAEKDLKVRKARNGASK